MTRIEKLVKEIKCHSDLYFNGLSEISDEEFDKMVVELKELDPNNPVLKTVGAPVFGERKWKKTKHPIPMGSLDKVAVENISIWMENCRYYNSSVPGTPQVTEFIVMDKYDGLSIALYYKNGKLVKAVTRGNGEEGSDILENVSKMKNVKMEIPLSGNLTVKAEIILTKKDFQEVNKISEKKFSNPRNAASGISGSYDGNLCEYLSLKYYDISSTTEMYCANMSQKLDWLEEVFPTGEYGKDYQIIYNSLQFEEIYKIYINSVREKLSYIVDGLVLGVNSMELRDKMGIVDSRPKAATAVKFPSPSAKTILKDVLWNLSRTGRINPKAELVPVEIDGSTVTFATLHNIPFIKNLGLGYGDVVIVKKAGDIIPAVVEVAVHMGKPIEIPSTCPVCGEKLTEEEIFLLCKNLNCPAKNFEGLKHYCATLEMDYVGDALIEKIFDYELAFIPADLYRITREQLLQLEGVGDSHASNFLNKLRIKSEMSSARFFTSLGLDGLATKNSEILEEIVNSKYNGSINDFLEDMVSAEGENIIGKYTEPTAKKIFENLKKKISEIQELLEFVTIKKSERASGGKLNGMSFCITGKLENMKRDDYIKIINTNGGEYKSSVGKGLTYLVTNDTESGSSKNQKAKELGVQIISEEELRGMLK
jgi:DNA ligase (NAD+)